jgi:hypothetical protein
MPMRWNDPSNPNSPINPQNPQNPNSILHPNNPLNPLRMLQQLRKSQRTSTSPKEVAHMPDIQVHISTEDGTDAPIPLQPTPPKPVAPPPIPWKIIAGVAAAAALIAVATYLVYHRSGAHPRTLFGGTWLNDDPHTRVNTKLVIAQDGSRVSVHAFGACSPHDCDWGTQQGFVENGIVRIDWSRGRGVRMMELTVKPGGRLNSVMDVGPSVSYPSGRWPTDSFHRQP